MLKRCFGEVLTEVLAPVLFCDAVFCVLRACSKKFNESRVRWYIRFIALVRDALLFVIDEEADKGFVGDKGADNDIIYDGLQCAKHRHSASLGKIVVVFDRRRRMITAPAVEI